MHRNLTDVLGIKVGHAHNLTALTGCTVILSERGATAGVDVRGSAPGTRETDLLRPGNFIEKVHAIVLSGGSAFGLDAAGGVMRYLEQKQCGLTTSAGKVPIVPCAVLYDLAVGSSEVRPDMAMGYQACLHAKKGPLQEGNVGAGAGATIGKMLGIERCMKGGIGNWAQTFGEGVILGVLAVVNAWGEVIGDQGEILAGMRDPENGMVLPTLKAMERYRACSTWGQNTTLVVIATNACLDKDGAHKLAQWGHNGLARSIRPAHTVYDGDTVFALATGEMQADAVTLGAVAEEVVSIAIRRAVLAAAPAGGIPGRG